MDVFPNLGFNKLVCDFNYTHIHKLWLLVMWLCEISAYFCILGIPQRPKPTNGIGKIQQEKQEFKHNPDAKDLIWTKRNREIPVLAVAIEPTCLLPLTSHLLLSLSRLTEEDDEGTFGVVGYYAISVFYGWERRAWRTSIPSEAATTTA